MKYDEKRSEASISSKISPNKIVKKIMQKSITCFSDYNRSEPDERVFYSNDIDADIISNLSPNDESDSNSESQNKSSYINVIKKSKSLKDKKEINFKIVIPNNDDKIDSDRSKRQTNPTSNSSKKDDNNNLSSKDFDIKLKRVMTDFNDNTKGVEFSIVKNKKKSSFGIKIQNNENIN